MFSALAGHATGVSLVVAAVLLGLLYKVVLRVIFGTIIIPNNQIGIVKKKFVAFGKNRVLAGGQIVALNGEAGIQADTLGPGAHFKLWPWQYKVSLVDFTAIPQGKIGIVESRAGKALDSGRILAKAIDCDAFQDTRAFLQQGGQRGPQLAILTPGTYRINTAVFNIKLEVAKSVPESKVGIVTTLDGAPLKPGDIAGPNVTGHNNFQDGQAFINANGSKGLQEQIILAGTYYINPLFAQVDFVDMTEVPIAHVGVVISYVGEAGTDVSGDSFKHGNLVGPGQRGVRAEPLDPGRYPINTLTTQVVPVPTANVVLNWATGKSEAHKLDANLSTITVRSADGFTFNLDVSQIIHISREAAARVIARFGKVENLVTQVLEPTIGNYFRNAAQNSDVIAFLKERESRQMAARQQIAGALKDFDVTAVDTLIGDIVPPAELMKTLTDRKTAEQQNITYATQQTAEESRQKLEQARAIANTQAKVVDAERTVSIAEFNATAQIASAKGEAESKLKLAESQAKQIEMLGAAEAGKVRAVGTAEAEVTQKKTDAMDKNSYALVEVVRALADAKTKLVPDIVAGGSGDGQLGGLVNVLLADLIQHNGNSWTRSNNKIHAVVEAAD